ncbi:hypothetical protein Bca4012_065283 [Brassica carinata]
MTKNDPYFWIWKFTNVGSAGNFPLSQRSAPIGYEDVLSSQNKVSNHLLALQHQQQHNENSVMWHHGHGSRTMSGLPANTYYNLQAQQHNYNRLSKQQEGIIKLSNNNSVMDHMATLVSISHKQKCCRSASSKTLELVQGLRLFSPQIKPINSGKTITK